MICGRRSFVSIRSWSIILYETWKPVVRMLVAGTTAFHCIYCVIISLFLLFWREMQLPEVEITDDTISVTLWTRSEIATVDNVYKRKNMFVEKLNDFLAEQHYIIYGPAVSSPLFSIFYTWWLWSFIPAFLVLHYPPSDFSPSLVPHF